MQTINLFQAKTHLSKLIDQIASGEETEFIIARSGKPVARILPVAPPNTSRRIGIAKGEFVQGWVSWQTPAARSEPGDTCQLFLYHPLAVPHCPRRHRPSQRRSRPPVHGNTAH